MSTMDFLVLQNTFGYFYILKIIALLADGWVVHGCCPTNVLLDLDSLVWSFIIIIFLITLPHTSDWVTDDNIDSFFLGLLKQHKE